MSFQRPDALEVIKALGDIKEVRSISLVQLPCHMCFISVATERFENGFDKWN